MKNDLSTTKVAPNSSPVTYSQYGEDLVIDALFSHKCEGFYVDVGANDPDILSNTKLFYNKGWHGINIEPTPHLYTKLYTKRDRDINLGVGVGPEPGLMTFYRMSADTLSSFNKEAAIKGGELYGATLISEDPTPVMKLADILEANLEGTEIDFLSVDAEGYDLAVLKSNDWLRYQPSVIIVEINVGGNEIIEFLQKHDYTLIFDNGTNGIFVSRKFLVTIDDRAHADLARLGQKHNLETFFPCSDNRNNLVVNFVYGHMRQGDNRAVHNGSISIIWSTLPVKGCDVYVYHNAFSYRGKKGGIDFLLMLEPVVVQPGEFDESVWKHFDHIFGLFDALAAQSEKFHKILFPRAAIPGIPGKNPVTEIQSRRESLYPISGRKNAICMISGNKQSHVPSELYSKRVEAAQWFSKNSEMPFEVFGRPPFALPNYRGAIPDGEKLSVMKRYRYNLCFENTNHPVLSAGYVTEKILDCLEARTIPIYLGASNIEQYIPPECFIDFRKFADFRELDVYLHSISEKKYKNYIAGIDAFVCGGGLRKFSVSRLYDDVVKVLIDEKILDGKYFRNNMGWRTGISPSLRRREWKTADGPVMWTWKHLMKAEPPVLENGKIIKKRQNESIDHTKSTSALDPKYSLLRKKSSIKVLVASAKFSAGNALRGHDYAWWNLFDALNRFENIKIDFFDYPTEAQQRGLAGMSERLEKIVREENPDVLFYWPLDPDAGILQETLKFITDHKDTQTVIWMNNHQGLVEEETKPWAACADCIITTSHETANRYIAANSGVKIIKSQWGFNPFTYASTQSPEIREISFCGTARSKRAEIVEKIKQSGLTVDVFGSGWHEDSFIPFCDMVSIFSQSRINLNLGDTFDHSTQQTNRRTFEVPGCGGFLLTTPADHLEEYYEPGKELAVASSPEELVDQCRYYLNHEYERKAIAQRGYERTIAEHTWSHRLRDIFMHIGFRAVPNQLPINNKSTAFVKSSMACIPKSEEGSTLDCAHEKLLDNDQDKIDTSIIVLAFNKLEYTKKCVESILHYTASHYELLLVDNGSTDGTFEYFEWVKRFHPHTRVIKHLRNREVALLSNHVFSLARGKYIVSVSNDTLVHEGWLENFIRQIESAPDIGMVGPRSNNVSGPQIMPTEYRTVEAYHNFAVEWCKRHDGSNFTAQRLAGIAAILKKEILGRVGGFDPDLSTNGGDGGYGFGDDDFSIRLILAGYKLLVANDVFIHHFGSVATKQQHPDLISDPQNINKEKYIRKLKSNDRVTIGPHGEITLKPYSLNDRIPVAENTIIRSPRICIVEIDTNISQSADDLNRYASLANSYDGKVVSIGNDSKRTHLIEAITRREFDFIAVIAKRPFPPPEKVQALIDSALCYPDVAIMVPIGNYAPFTHACKTKEDKGVEIIRYADLSVCVINTNIIRSLTRGLTQIDNDEECFWFLQRRIRGEGYFIAKCNDVTVDLDEPRVNHSFDTRILPESLINKKKYEEAIAIYENDLRKDPTFVDSMFQLACVAQKRRKVSQAIEFAENALRIDSHHIQSLILLSKIFIKQGNIRRAKTFVGQANFKQPGNPEVREIVSQYEKLKEKKGAKQDSDQDFSEEIRGRVSIIIPVTEQARYLQDCITSIEKNTPESHEILFISDGHDANAVKCIEEILKTNSNCKLFTAENMNRQSQFFNLGLQEVSGEYVVLLHKDTVVGKGWLTGMLECINEAGDATGIVSPMTNTPAAGRQYVPQTSQMEIEDFEAYAAAFHKRNRRRWVSSNKLKAFCMLFRRTLIEEVGAFDANLEQGSDIDDYCLRAAIEGYRCIICGDVFVLCAGFHHQENLVSFILKWSKVNENTHEGKRLGIVNAMSKSEKFYQHEELDRAIRTLVEGLKYNPHEEAIYHALAEMLIDCKRYQDALDSINSLPEGKKDNQRTLELKAYCKAGLGLNEEALQLAEKILMLNKSSVKALNLKGILAQSRNCKGANEEFFKKAIAVDPGDGKAYTNLGKRALEDGRKDDALPYLEKGFVLTPTAADCITAYHSAVLEFGNTEKAEALFREAKALHPENRRIAFLLIDILIRREDYESAIQNIREAMVVFGIDDGILSAARAIMDRLAVQKFNKPKKNPALTLSMIVKNEEDNLAKCLLSAINVVDEIVVVDTGSTDRTKAIAETFGARVYDFECGDDLSQARNFSLSKASGDWILVLNPDEKISSADCNGLVDIAKKKPGQPVAYSMIIKDHPGTMSTTGWGCHHGQSPEEKIIEGRLSSEIRLFTNDKRIRFENSAQRLRAPSLEKHGIDIEKSDIPIYHYGKVITK